MLEFITKYWLEVVFGLIVTGLTITVKRIWSMYKKEKANHENENKQELLEIVDKKIEEQRAEMVRADGEITNEIGSINSKLQLLNSGILAIQGQSFREACHLLLEPDHTISLEEYEQLSKDHEVYNDLGGNHFGDRLFSLVETKFSEQTQK